MIPYSVDSGSRPEALQAVFNTRGSELGLSSFVAPNTHVPEVNDPTVGVGIRGRSVAAPWRRDGPVAA